MSSTICALATPPGAGGIAVVRVSGPEAYAVVGEIFTPRNPAKRVAEAKGYTAMLGHYHLRGEEMDETIALFFRAPHSYTGEDVIELSVHGGNAMAQGLLEALYLAGAAPAGPGEFTRRALENGRMSLTQAEAVMEVILCMNTDLTPDEATLLYIGLTTDTGCFQYSNTSAASFRAAAELLRLGADNSDVNLRFFRRVSPARLKLEGLIYSGLGFYRDGKITVAEITRAMMAQSGASEDDMDDIASLAGRADGCVLSITIREQADGTCRLSLRSTSEVNSSDICAVFGGGGHALAAGCTISGSVEKARELILDVVNEVWK